MNTKRFFSVLFVSLLTFSAALAQEALTLGEAVARGLENNYDILIEDQNVAIAENNNSWGEAGRWPQINLNVNQNNQVTDNKKTASPFALQDVTISSSVSPGVALNWMLFNGFKVNISKYKLENLQEQSSGNAVIVVENTLQALILGYYKCILDLERTKALQRQLNLSKDKYTYLKVKADLGAAVTSDLLLEEGNYLIDSLNVISQMQTYRNSVRSLNLLMGEKDVDKDYLFTEKVVIPKESYSYDDLYTRMVADNSTLKNQYIALSILKNDLGIRKADKYPQLSFAGGVNSNWSRVDLSNASFPQDDGSFVSGPSDPLSANSLNYFGNFTLSFTLFNGGKINRAIQNAVIQEDIGNIRIDKMENSLSRDLSDMLDAYNTRQLELGINTRRLEVTELNLSINQEKFKNGTINSFDFRTIQNNQLSAAILELQSMYNVIDAHISLLKITGGIIREFGE